MNDAQNTLKCSPYQARVFEYLASPLGADTPDVVHIRLLQLRPEALGMSVFTDECIHAVRVLMQEIHEEQKAGTRA